MVQKIFLDTNCVIDLLYKRDLSYSHLLDTKIIFISALSIHIAIYVAKDRMPKKSFEQFLQFMDVVSLDQQVLVESFAGPTSDFEDNIQLNSALQSGATHFYTKDATLLKLGSHKNIAIVQPLSS
jgi:predicted nucleic acid-binding protein